MSNFLTNVICTYMCIHIMKTLVIASATNSVSVKSAAGIFNGCIREFEEFGERRRVEKYLGVPYAEPPVGSRRFQKSVLKETLKEPHDASKFGSACFQLPFPSSGVRKPGTNVTRSEDCLFLNIVVPRQSRNIKQTTSGYDRRLPVMVWIHGGGYNLGQSNSFDGDTISAVGNVIFVTLNYRLAVWGFLSTGDNHMPGNYGLWDQHVALQWIHTNIADFGGDPDHVTLIGLSAGGTSVLHQSLYAGNRGLFQRAVAMSGTITCPWAFNKNPLAATKRLSELAGCQTSDNTEKIAACIKSLPNDKLFDLLLDNVDKIIKFPIDFVVVVDGEFVKEYPEDIISGTSDISSADREFFASLDFMTGNVNGEGMMNVCPFVGARNSYQDFTVTRQRFEEFFVPEALRITYGDDVHSVVKEMVISQYTDWSQPDDIVRARDSFIEMTSDYVFKMHTGKTLRLHTKASKKSAYLYNFDALPSHHIACFPTWSRRPVHGDELTFMFGHDPNGWRAWTMPWSENFSVPQWESDMTKFYMTMITNFAKSGNPNEPEDITYYTGTRWPTYNVETQLYLNITRDMSVASVGRRLYARAEHFWNNLLPATIRAFNKH